MEFDKNKVDEATLALLWLNNVKDDYGTRAWKGFDWDSMDRLHEKGFIGNPKGKAKSVAITEEGVEHAKKLFERIFAPSKYVAIEMFYKVVLQKSEEGYSVSCPVLPGCWSQGGTELEALGNIKDAIEEYLEVTNDEFRKFL